MINKVILVGRLGKDPEIRHLENGAVVANFSIATSERYKAKDGDWQDKTEWHNIAAWRSLAEFSEKWLKKGGLVFIEGKIRTRSWEDKDKNKRYTTEVVADVIRKLDWKKDEAGSSQEPELAESNNEDVKDDLPF
jgi:single-strand DNA-binding protein